MANCGEKSARSTSAAPAMVKPTIVFTRCSICSPHQMAATARAVAAAACLRRWRAAIDAAGGTTGARWRDVIPRFSGLAAKGQYNQLTKLAGNTQVNHGD